MRFFLPKLGLLLGVLLERGVAVREVEVEDEDIGVGSIDCCGGS